MVELTEKEKQFLNSLETLFNEYGMYVDAPYEFMRLCYADKVYITTYKGGLSYGPDSIDVMVSEVIE